jgi:SAM-dependent methyltransferase
MTLFRHLPYLRHAHAEDIPARVRRSIEDIRLVECRIHDQFAVALRGLDVLEVGPGQYLSQMTYFAMHNRVTGIDLDVIAHAGASPLAYVDMLRFNGARRTTKTIGRKLMGIDRAYAAELHRQLSLQARPRHQVLRMDVSELQFPDQSFDLVYSRAVFHHLPDAQRAIREVARVLRPGGVAYIALHPFTNPTGCLDPRVMMDGSNLGDAWPHLRPETQDWVRPCAFINKLRVPKWRSLFREEMPGVAFVLPCCDASYVSAAKSLHAQGHLTEFTIDELTAGEFVAFWRR